MNNEVSHIHEPAFRQAIASIVEEIDPAKIICFGFHSSLARACSCFHADLTQEKFHYDLLLVRREKDKRKETEIIDQVERAGSETLSINVITHSEHAVKKALKSNNPFFFKIFREGAVVYTCNEYTDEEISALPAQHCDEMKRRSEWARWFELSERFLSSGSDAIGNGWYDLGVFLLHQAMEHGCIAILRAHMMYRPSTHNVTRLMALVRTLNPRVNELFPCNTNEEVALFSYLRNSYSDVRYKERYHIPEHIAFTLFERVSAFCDLIGSLNLEIYEPAEMHYQFDTMHHVDTIGYVNIRF